MHFTMSHTTSLLCVSYLDHLSQIVTNIREIILQTTRVFFRRAWWKEVVLVPYSHIKRLKKCLVPYQFKLRQLTFPSLVRLPLAFSPGCVGAILFKEPYKVQSPLRPKKISSSFANEVNTQ